MYPALIFNERSQSIECIRFQSVERGFCSFQCHTLQIDLIYACAQRLYRVQEQLEDWNFDESHRSEGLVSNFHGLLFCPSAKVLGNTNNIAQTFENTLITWKSPFPGKSLPFL